nr:T9SS type A sorting domain-containing protein [Bacteroidota bacterium]
MTNIFLSIIFLFLPLARMFEAVAKEAINNNNSSLAFQKLSAMINQNTIDENNNYMVMLVALNYDASLDADSDTIVVVNNIANQHPFYGGEAVYIARAMLHVTVEDVLPPLRRKNKANLKNIQIENAIKLIPNPAKYEVQIVSKTKFDTGTFVEIVNTLGSIILKKKINTGDFNFSIDISSLQSGVYTLKITKQGLVKTIEKLVILK